MKFNKELQQSRERAKELEKANKDLKDLLEIERAVNLKQCPKVNLKKGDYFTVQYKDKGSTCKDIYCFIKEQKLNPSTSIIFASEMKSKIVSGEVKLIPDTFWNNLGAREFLTNKYDFYKYNG